MRLLPVLALAACTESTVSKFNSAPAVSISSPADGAEVADGSTVEFYGRAIDQQDDPETLSISWESSVDGVLGTDPPDASGDVYQAVVGLSGGAQVVTLTATDLDGEASSASVSLSVGAGVNTEGAPTVVIASPGGGDSFGQSEAVNLVATVTDDEDAADTLLVDVTDGPDGLIWSGSPSGTGVVTVEMDPSIATHTLTVSAVDSDGNVGTASVEYDVIEDGTPTVTIDEPADGSTGDTTDTLTFRGTISDDETAVESLTVEWSSSLAGVLSTAPADSSGSTAFGAALAAGVHTITLAVTDTDGKQGRDTILLTVEDPLDRDDDGDGWTENAGDCDDADATVNPDAEDICDDLDNNCDGQINEAWLDGYEPNDTQDTAYDAGEVDEDLGWSNSTLEMAGLTLHYEDDEDWIRWDFDDEYWDNVEITIVATGFPSKGDYVIELWSLDTGSFEGSDSGTSGLSLGFSGSLVDDDEDHWALRVYALTWPADSCDVTYDLTIRS